MPLPFRSSVKAVLKSARNYRYHHTHVTQATRILKSIESYRGTTTNRDIKLCDAYAVDVLGHKHFAPWLYVYSAVSGGFKAGWVPDNYYGSIVVPKIKGGYRNVSLLTTLNAALFQSDSFPDLLSYANGIFFDTEYRLVPLESVKDKLFKNHDRVVFKLDNSSQGLGIHLFDCDSFSVQKVESLGNGLFQSFIKQHDVFTEFAKDSVATIRITSVFKDSGDVSIRACYLRLGSGSDTHVQSKSHVRVPIDLAHGAFNDVGYTTEWLETKIHPTSKVAFSGNYIPAFRECIHTVTELHKKVPYVRCIGWDLTVDLEEKVRLMEWNAGHNDIKFSEATQGPCFADLGWEQLRNKLAH